ncbi:MAG TPA: GNAT family N-acetyltransferase [Herpetosiphonaceae bacterium]
MGQIERWDAADAARNIDGLVELLRDSVDGGASVGFLPPLAAGEARRYWEDVIRELSAGERILLAARDATGLAGAAQLALPAKPNASHRAEVQKLLVHSRARRAGLGRALMAELEGAARAAGRLLLVLDTREGDAAERLYRALGYRAAGVIPGYARSADGRLDGSVFFYRALDEEETA